MTSPYRRAIERAAEVCEKVSKAHAAGWYESGPREAGIAASNTGFFAAQAIRALDEPPDEGVVSEPVLTADVRVGAGLFRKGVLVSTVQGAIDRWINDYLTRPMTYYSTEGCEKHHGQPWTTFLGNTIMPTKVCPLCNPALNFPPIAHPSPPPHISGCATEINQPRNCRSETARVRRAK